MEVSATEAVHTYCWISLRYFEYKSILEVSWQQEPLGVEVIPNSNPTYIPKNWIKMIDLLTSRLSNEIAKYFAWKPDPHSLATDAMQQEWNQEVLYPFLPFLVIERVFCKAVKEKVNIIILITLARQTEPCYSIFLQSHFFNLSCSQCLKAFWRTRMGKIIPFRLIRDIHPLGMF